MNVFSKFTKFSRLAAKVQIPSLLGSARVAQIWRLWKLMAIGSRSPSYIQYICSLLTFITVEKTHSMYFMILFICLKQIASCIFLTWKYIPLNVAVVHRVSVLCMLSYIKPWTDGCGIKLQYLHWFVLHHLAIIDALKTLFPAIGNQWRVLFSSREQAIACGFSTYLQPWDTNIIFHNQPHFPWKLWWRMSFFLLEWIDYRRRSKMLGDWD